MVVIVGAIAELERSLIVERVWAGMRRAKLKGRRIGRKPLDIDREQVVRDRRSGMSLRQVAREHGISRASVCRLVKEAGRRKNGNVPQVGNQERSSARFKLSSRISHGTDVSASVGGTALRDSRPLESYRGEVFLGNGISSPAALFKRLSQVSHSPTMH
jgi:transposase-like protein